MSSAMLFESLSLPNGTVLPNRLAKAAMEESMADGQNGPSDTLIRLYASWARGGIGLLISGNVMVDSRAMTGPGGVVLEDERHLPAFTRWAQAGRGDGQFWLQINHPGRQVFASMKQPAWAPSAVPLEMGSFSKMFAPPREMTAAEIQEVSDRFVRTAVLAQKAGFDGVEIHAAHGYLLSQFLSPLSNRRTDQWGGSLANRARLLLDVVRGIRQAVGPQFGVAVKLNSADFQRGGFDANDAKQVVTWLNDLQVDFVELSGGSYEAPAMQGQTRDGRTLAREAYFLEFAKDIAKVATMPVMVTGGIRRRSVAEAVLQSGVDLVGMGTALALAPDLPKQWQAGQDAAPLLAPVRWKSKALSAMATMALVRRNMHRLGAGRDARPKLSPLWTLLKDQWAITRKTRAYHRWMTARAR